MRSKRTISIPIPLSEDLRRAAKGLGVTESEFVRRAVQQQLWDEAYEASRRILTPAARARGLCTDDDVFEIIS